MYIYDMTSGLDLSEMSTFDILEYKRDILLYTAYRHFGHYGDVHAGEFYAQCAAEFWPLSDYQQRVLYQMRRRAWSAKLPRSK